MFYDFSHIVPSLLLSYILLLKGIIILLLYIILLYYIFYQPITLTKIRFHFISCRLLGMRSSLTWTQGGGRLCLA